MRENASLQANSSDMLKHEIPLKKHQIFWAFKQKNKQKNPQKSEVCRSLSNLYTAVDREINFAAGRNWSCSEMPFVLLPWLVELEASREGMFFKVKIWERVFLVSCHRRTTFGSLKRLLNILFQLNLSNGLKHSYSRMNAKVQKNHFGATKKLLWFQKELLWKRRFDCECEEPLKGLKNTHLH